MHACGEIELPIVFCFRKKKVDRPRLFFQRALPVRVHAAVRNSFWPCGVFLYRSFFLSFFFCIRCWRWLLALCRCEDVVQVFLSQKSIIDWHGRLLVLHHAGDAGFFHVAGSRGLFWASDTLFQSLQVERHCRSAASPARFRRLSTPTSS